MLDVEHTINIAMSVVENVRGAAKDDPALAQLKGHGFLVSDNKSYSLCTLLHKVATSSGNRDRIPRRISASITGWVDNCTTHIVPSSPYYTGYQDDYMSVVGSGIEWQRVQRNAFKMCPTTAFMIAGGLSGYLRGILDIDSSLIIHLYGPSSRGKTLALRHLASWAGDVRSGVNILRWSSSEVGREALLNARNGAYLALDELHSLREKAGTSICTQLMDMCNGGGRAVGTRNGSLREPKSWNAVVGSSGNTSISAKTKNDDQFEALMARVIDLDIDEYPMWSNGFGDMYVEDVEQILNNNYGFGYKLIIDAIKANQDEIKVRYREFSEESYEIFAAMNAPLVGRRCKHLSGIWATTFIIDSIFDKDNKEDDIPTCFMLREFIMDLRQSWVLEAKQSKQTDAEYVRESILKILSTHSQNVFVKNHWYGYEDLTEKEKVSKNNNKATQNGIKIHFNQNRVMNDPINDLDGILIIPKNEDLFKESGVQMETLVNRAKRANLFHTSKNQKDYVHQGMRKFAFVITPSSLLELKSDDEEEEKVITIPKSKLTELEAKIKELELKLASL